MSGRDTRHSRRVPKALDAGAHHDCLKFSIDSVTETAQHDDAQSGELVGLKRSMTSC